VATSETLRSVIDAGRTAKRLDELSTARVIGKIAEQLHASQHKAGSGKAIGPITPAGILLEPSGAAKLGLAEPAAVTYSSPEQITEDVGDRRSDVFSLGTVMWEALTHEPLFADAVEVKTKPIVSPSEFNANIPAELGSICMKALARNPVDRYQSAKVMAAEIEAVLEEAGYADTDERIGEYLAELGKPQALPKVTLLTPPGGLTAPTSLLTGQPARLNDTLPSLGAPLPPVLPAKPTDPPKNKPIPKFVEAKLAEARAEDVAESAPTEKFERVEVHPFAATPIEAPPVAAPLIAAKPASLPPVETLKPVEPVKPVELPKAVEVAKPLPAPNLDAKPKVELPKVHSSSTVLGFASAAATETVSPKAEPAVLATPPVEASPAASDPILLATPKSALPEPMRPKPSGTSPAPTAPAAAPIQELPKVASSPVPAAAIIKEGSKPNPAGVVALPSRRDSTGTVEVLGGWGWGTDSHEAISDDDAYDDKPPRKILLYVIGGGVGLAALVTIMAIGFGGGSSKKPAPQPVPTVQEAMQPPGSGAGSAIQTVVATGTPSAGSSATGDVASAADVIAAMPPDAAIAEVTPPPAIDAAVAVVPPDAAAVVVAPPRPPPPPRPEPPKPVHHETPVAAHHAEPARVAHAEPPPHSRMSQGDVDAAYKQGLQLYMRGDTEGALASLRAALAGNPGYPPTWRGLGLVYEKLGEKDQARAAYRRYLQLAPNAGDADKIRNRLERL
jgi:hypothetical protein